MGRTRQGSTSALVADDVELAQLCLRYAEHAPPDGLGADSPAQAEAALADAARAARTLASRRVPGAPVVEVRGRDRGSTVVEIVTDDLPYLVESVLAGVGRVGGRVRRVIHPTVLVRRELDGALVEVLAMADPECPPPGALTEAWMHLELEPFPADELDDLATELRQVLGEVREVAEDADRMVATALGVAADLIARPPPLPAVEARDAARLLEWLVDGHFTFLGYRHYQVDRVDGAERMRATLASGLGVLRRDSLTSRPFVSPVVGGVDSGAERLLVLTQASSPSRVLRPVYPYHLGVTEFDENGLIIGEHRFLGMLTVAARQANVLAIPGIERRVRAAMNRAGFPLESHAGQRMLEVISEYPREELFWASAESLRETATGVLSLTQPRRLRLFLHREPYRRFFSCLVYLPRDRYSTRTRLALQQVLLRELDGWRVDHTARVGESSLALVHFVVRTDPDAPEPDRERLQGQLAAAALSWDDWLLDVAGEADTEIADYLPGVPEGYKDDVDPVRALAELHRIRDLDAGPDSEPELSLELGADPGELRFRLFLTGEGITLSSVLPVLQSLGVEVLDERPYPIGRPDGTRCWIYQFGLRTDVSTWLAISGRRWEPTRREFCAAFQAIWRGDAEVDGFNTLVLRIGLGWRDAALLRAYAGYARQLGSPFDARYSADTLLAHPSLARALVRLFRARFDPELPAADRERGYPDVLAETTALLDQVIGLDADRILRGYLTAMLATLRTNFFVGRRYFSFKIDPGAIPEMPPPKPRFEIFVYSPWVEGVHLRFGPVARGGLRWSDRPTDYRTEILGLVKAQAVKNAVIVPVGAKGGFVLKGGEPGPEQVTAGYRTFVSGLLDLTDNVVGGVVVPAQGVVRHDADDSYLVVAADKGTARMSDVANALAVERGFWLGDAFASGGSVGYDHKAMGITAKGAWESVKRHFRELGVDTQAEPITVVGIGDMSGDVFGNGMLLSEHIRLVAAFDHRHVFVDPSPDPSTSFAERRRLFGLARSSWEDYDRSLISPGGGVWPRTVKAVPIAAEVRAALGLPDPITQLTPPELIRAILRAPADLLWNGGIGTYVKSSGESHADAGDKANDPVRVDGGQLGVRVVGEGGNLGLTQRGRIEFARAGGKVNTDALDNSAGVDCSDHEVNIKILLDRLVDFGELGRADRDQLLREMTEDVGELVLADNRAQNAELGIARGTAAALLGVHGRMIADLEARRGLDRTLEELPDQDGLAELARLGAGLTSPELATLQAHVKLDLKLSILDSELPELPVFAERLTSYFPPALTARYPDAVAVHPLRREIVTTLLVNEMVDCGGSTFAFRLAEDAGAGATDAPRAFRVVAEVFELPALWSEIAGLPAEVPSAATDRLVLATRGLLDAGTRWFLAHRSGSVAEELARFGPPVRRLIPRLPTLLRGREADGVRREAAELVELGVPAALADRVAGLRYAVGLLDVVEVGELADRGRARLPVEEVAELYYALSERRNYL
ncbi:MAG TPA: NAD-glutamate dehydrogenase [Pseudonocardia sp.]|uniref:NAD-glutamate dehydrogenase n=1 Tax=Pseudonocardia sp. TaxID=60912 RepID=UPI002D0499B1|nr:NAD-glutamate dehydrogenase [Pseudonocardia sp.]HTF45939.1 NAD-glutamate dehydrogenase [Pseudonocardia sp.]